MVGRKKHRVEQAVQLVAPRQAAASTRDRGLLLIALFKLGKAIFFFLLGCGAVHFMDRNLGDEIIRIAMGLKRDPEGRMVQLVLEKADLINVHQLRQISVFTFGYSALALTEGIGLFLEKVWAEYLTLTLTISLLPWELYELARRPDWLRFGVLLTNLAVLWYLIWLLQRKKARGFGR